MNLSRPKPGENEDDILRQQEEFIKSRSASTSAKLVNKRKGADDPICSGGNNTKNDPSKRNRSQFSLTRTKESSTNAKVELGNLSVLGEIKEKNLEANFLPINATTAPQKGFPQAFYRDKSLKPRGKSIFSQQCVKSKKTPEVDNEVHEKVNRLSGSKETFGDKSFIVSGTEADAVHEENIIRLSKMSHDEILMEQQKLKSALDPKVLHFILSRRNRAGSMSVNTAGSEYPMQISEKSVEESEMETGETEDISASMTKLQTSNHLKAETGIDEAVLANTLTPLVSDSANKWLHMDVVEIEKLQWISEIPEPPPLPPDKAYSARFDFQGLLLPYFDEKLDVNRGLHHHGEDPARPGYTLQELFQLTRSSVLQQRILAITAISNILEKTKSGYYDKCMQEPLLKIMLDSDLLLLLRFSLDDNMESIATASLLALRNFLWNFPDEVCLDRLLGCNRGIEQPTLEVKIEVKPEKKEELQDEEKELKDYQMARIDTIKGTLRTDVVLRLRYILETLQPGPKAVIAALEILTRIARHSHESVLAISSCPRLLTIIVKNFLAKDWRPLVGDTKPQDMTSVYGVPLVQALKLVRVLACGSRNIATELSSVYQILGVLISYISIDPRECGLPQSEALRLSLESLYLWQTLLAYNLATQTFMDMYPVLMRLLQFHLNCTSTSDDTGTFGHEHGAALLSLINQATSVAKHQKMAYNNSSIITLPIEQFSSYVNPIEMCTEKWLSQLKQADKVTFSALKLLSSAFNCLATMYSCCQSMANDVVSQLEQIENMIENKVVPFLQSSNYENITRNIKQSSCLLYQGPPGTERDPGALPSLGSLLWGGEKVTPVLQPRSPFLILGGLASLLRAAYGLHKGLKIQVCKLFMNDDLISYLNDLLNQKQYFTGHWFTRVEVFFLFDLIMLSRHKDIEPSWVFHSLSVKLVGLTSATDKLLAKQLLKMIVFSPLYFRDASIVSYGIRNIKLDDSKAVSALCHLLQESINNLDNIHECYEETFGLEAVTQDILNITCLTSKAEQIHVDNWMYLPILKLKDKGSSGKAASGKVISTASASLEWIFILEYLRPSAIAAVNITERYCHLSKLFLAASDLFLEPKVSTLFEFILREMLQRNSEMDFKSSIPGVSSFYDLYNELLEQFAAVSYGSVVFGQFIIVPLQQRHGTAYRKLLWSEQAAVLRVLGVPIDKLMIPLEELLEPCEMDPSLLNIYLQNLATGVVQGKWSPVLYRVAIHHVATYVKCHNDILAQQLKEKILKLGNKELQSELLCYGTRT